LVVQLHGEVIERRLLGDLRTHRPRPDDRNLPERRHIGCQGEPPASASAA
jgi:hypothetical protein